MTHAITSFSGEHRFLSNFWLHPVTIDAWTFPSSEHAYQAAKSASETDWLFFINPQMTPGQAKRMGAKLALREGWDKNRVEIMHEILKAKFSDAHMAQILIGTGDAELIEGNHWGDTFWGVCKGVGQNHLGRLLMEVRANL